MILSNTLIGTLTRGIAALNADQVSLSNAGRGGRCEQPWITHSKEGWHVGGTIPS